VNLFTITQNYIAVHSRWTRPHIFSGRRAPQCSSTSATSSRCLQRQPFSTVRCNSLWAGVNNAFTGTLSVDYRSSRTSSQVHKLEKRMRAPGLVHSDSLSTPSHGTKVVIRSLRSRSTKDPDLCGQSDSHYQRQLHDSAIEVANALAWTMCCGYPLSWPKSGGIKLHESESSTHRSSRTSSQANKLENE
jgi:hypothetical protein